MQISEISEDKANRRIIISYELDEYIYQFTLPDLLFNFLHFSQNYLKVNEELNQEPQFITIDNLRESLRQFDKETATQKLIAKLNLIEEDLKNRNLIVLDLPSEPKFERRIPDELIDSIKRLGFQQNGQKGPLLYVAYTTLLNHAVKVGISDIPINNHIEKMEENYSFKIKFKVLYCQHIPQITSKELRSYILKIAPESKLYLQVVTQGRWNFRYGFYFLTKQFVDAFESFLNIINEKSKQFQESSMISEVSRSAGQNQSYQINTLAENTQQQIQSVSEIRSQKLSNKGKKIILEALGTIKSKSPYFLALLYQAQIQREAINDFQN